MDDDKNRNLNIDDDSDHDEEEVKHPLEDQLVSMFPLTSRRYIRKRLTNLPGNPEAIARLTEELLNNPAPAGNKSGYDDAELVWNNRICNLISVTSWLS